jgi:nucleoside-diphosphate-sugar epimerase|tara:strand:- start:10442 stop:11437 length:996 start_codon:yes stop_codon:yes gene_type:complete
MKVLVAGGAGFIGSHLTNRLLSRGDEVTVVDSLITGRESNLNSVREHPKFAFHKVDINHPQHSQWINFSPFQETGGFDAILNLASPASPDDFKTIPIHILETGSIGNMRLLELAEKSNAKFLLASTSEVYGDPEVHPQKESYNGSVNPVGRRSCYDEAKRFAEASTMTFCNVYGTDTRIARIFNTYGEHINPHDGRVINTFIKQALTNKPLPIYGKGTQTRSFCHVWDLVEGLVKLLDLEDCDVKNQPFNLGNPTELTVFSLAEAIIEMTNSSSRIQFLPMPLEREGDPKLRCPDITLAKQYLNWEPEVPLHKGLKRTVDYFVNNEQISGI